MIAWPGPLDLRRAEVDGSADLAAMRARLGADLEPFLDRPLYLPERKALLSRWGGLCRDCRADLDFDPWSPDAQRCTGCGRVWSTEQSQRWWVYWYQLWFAERVLLCALLPRLGGDPRGTAQAAHALQAVVERYLSWPNADNVLGPSRPFFSTYLESIWVLHLATAATLLDRVGALDRTLAADLTARVFRPSAELIADFDEGRSNRQTWNAAALFALGFVLADEGMRNAAAYGPSGILATLDAGLAADGLWYEGENYHWFALRGLAWGVELVYMNGGVNLWKEASPRGAKWRAAFAAPVLTALPDFTFPARRDSKFGVTLRQRRCAELWELALARVGPPPPLGDPSGNGRAARDPRAALDDWSFLSSLLAHVYDAGPPERDDASRDSTEVERGGAPARGRRGAPPPPRGAGPPPARRRPARSVRLERPAVGAPGAARGARRRVASRQRASRGHGARRGPPRRGRDLRVPRLRRQRRRPRPSRPAPSHAGAARAAVAAGFRHRLLRHAEPAVVPQQPRAQRAVRRRRVAGAGDRPVCGVRGPGRRGVGVRAAAGAHGVRRRDAPAHRCGDARLRARRRPARQQHR
jgi:hypothetical protein